MRWSWIALGLAFVVAAGCVERSVPDAAMPSLLPTWQDFAACPVVAQETVPCGPMGDSPVEAPVRSLVPSGWSCLTFSDQRFGNGVPGSSYPYPDWYTYYGPSPGDGLSHATDSRAGILYDTHDDTETVGGAIVLRSENESQVFTFTGPARGFVELPRAITANRLLLMGILGPLGPVQGKFSDPKLQDAGFGVVSEGIQQLGPFWSTAPTTSGDPELHRRSWSMVLNGEVRGQPVHFLGNRTFATGLPDSAPLQGGAHWGVSRMEPFLVNVSGDGFSVHARIEPYIEFYAEFRDLHDASAVAGSRFLCACPKTAQEMAADPVLAAQCAVGLAGPTDVPPARSRAEYAPLT